MTDTKVFTVQPRFKYGDTSPGWGMIDGIFKIGEGVPPYGSQFRDMYLAYSWFNEPIMAGVFSTWIEKAQTITWKITGGRNLANFYARILHEADDGRGWTWHEGAGALDYLTTDKGSMEELGRKTLTPQLIHQLQDYYQKVASNPNGRDLVDLQNLINKAVLGQVASVQHLDSTRLMDTGLPGMRWRYYPDNGYPISIPDQNIIQVMSLPSGRDRHPGSGYSALSRILDGKNLMLGYLNYLRQEVGDLPPELIAIINGLSSTDFTDILNKYKVDKQAREIDEYGKILWMGSDDPSNPVTLDIKSLVTASKSFSYKDMSEWWVKTCAENVGEDVGEFWLLQRGESKTVQTVQAMKSKGKGVAKYLQEKERLYNMKVMPFGEKFEYDNQDDDQDKLAADILATKIGNLTSISALGVDRQDPIYSKEEIQNLAKIWGIIPPEMSGESVPVVLGAMVKEISTPDQWVVTQHLEEYPVKPLLKSDKDLRAAAYLYHTFKEQYVQSRNGHNDFRVPV